MISTLAAITIYDYIIFLRKLNGFQNFLTAKIASLVLFVSLIGSNFRQWLAQRFGQFIIANKSIQSTLQIGVTFFVSDTINYVLQGGYTVF